MGRKKSAKRKRTVEALDKKRYVSELVSRVAQKEGEVPEEIPSVQARPARIEEAKVPEKAPRISWYMREITFLGVKLPLWLIVGCIAIALALLLLAFWIGSVAVRPRYVVAYSEEESVLAQLSSQASLAGSAYLVASSPIRAVKESTLARSMVVVDQNSGSPLLYENPDQQMPIASLTKLMTAYVAVNTWRGPDVFTIAVSVNPDEESSAGLPVGEQYSRDSLLYALLIESAAEAGYTFADNYPGGRASFVSAMNAAAIELGMDSTRYVDPVGISEENISTAEDLAVLTRVILQNELLAKIVSTPAAGICSLANVCTTLETTNTLLTEFQNFYGVKTGYTVKAGPCLVARYEKGSYDFVIVLLYVEGSGTDNRFDVAEELSSLARSVSM